MYLNELVREVTPETFGVALARKLFEVKNITRENDLNSDKNATEVSF